MNFSNVLHSKELLLISKLTFFIYINHVTLFIHLVALLFYYSCILTMYKHQLVLVVTQLDESVLIIHMI